MPFGQLKDVWKRIFRFKTCVGVSR